MAEILDPQDRRLAAVHAQRLLARDIDQLLGICEFALQDGVVDQYEAEGILRWLNGHRACLDAWPASVLYDRLRAMLVDGVLDDDEQKELLELVMSLVRPKDETKPALATALPVDAPAPPIVLASRRFCFTGVFDFGSRAECQRAVESLGGIADKGVTKKLDYLVIGNVGSEFWRHQSFGAKIAKAVEYREAGVPLVIVSEDHWVRHLG